MTWPALDSSTPVLIQGMTGKEGARMAQWMMASGARVVAGVTPGKGGQEVEGRPIFNTVTEARAAFSDARVSCIAVPGHLVRAAAEEAMSAGVTLIYIIAERVPVHDVLAIRALAAKHGVTVFGPSSVGYLQFPKLRLGYLGGERPFETLHEGGLAVLSSSGGMTNETLMALARQNVGIRLALAVGGDVVNGCTLTEAVVAADAHPDVTAIAIFAEPGNPLLHLLIDGTVKPSKPVVLCVPGDALETLPRGMPYGHAGTILGEEDGSLADLRGRLTAAGYRTTARHDEFIDWCKTI